MEGRREEGSLSPGSEGAAVLPWDRFENWVHCFCVVTFDLELGQAMEVRATTDPKSSQ